MLEIKFQMLANQKSFWNLISFYFHYLSNFSPKDFRTELYINYKNLHISLPINLFYRLSNITIQRLKFKMSASAADNSNTFCIVI